MVARTTRRRSIRARRAARQGANSRLMAWLARAGLASRGVMYVLVGIIAVQIAVAIPNLNELIKDLDGKQPLSYRQSMGSPAEPYFTPPRR